MRKYVMTEMKYIFTTLHEKQFIKETRHVLCIRSTFNMITMMSRISNKQRQTPHVTQIRCEINVQ